MSLNASKFAFISFHFLFRIEPFQWVAGEKNKKNRFLAPARAAGCGPMFQTATASCLPPDHPASKKEIPAFGTNSEHSLFCQGNSRRSRISYGVGVLASPSWLGRGGTASPPSSRPLLLVPGDAIQGAVGRPATPESPRRDSPSRDGVCQPPRPGLLATTIPLNAPCSDCRGLFRKTCAGLRNNWGIVGDIAGQGRSRWLLASVRSVSRCRERGWRGHQTLQLARGFERRCRT
jgi:hypothetical protein